MNNERLVVGIPEEAANANHPQVIPIERKAAGRALYQARVLAQVTLPEVASKIKNVDPSEIEIFEKTGEASFTLRRLMRGVTRYIYEKDSSVQEIEKFAQGEEWIDTFTKEYMSFGRSL